MNQDIVGRGNNIKCYDRIRLTNIMTGQTLHACGFQWTSGSKNQAVSCHKTRDDSDWFVPVQVEEPSSSYHFKYGDSLYFSHSQSNDYLQLSQEHESMVSRKMQASLKAFQQGQQEWVIDCVQDSSQDQFWRVGELITIRNKQTKAYLCSLKKRIRQNDEYQVFGQKMKIESPGLKQKKMPEQCLWRVTQSVPFIYTPPIVEKKKPKGSQEQEELARLTKVSNQIAKQTQKRGSNDTGEIVKMENRRLQQVQLQAKKIQKQNEKKSCWRKLCCCLCLETEGYSKI